MYAGHAALALFAKAKRPQIPLALLVPAAFAPDWIAWIFDPLGHRNREISHSLVSMGICSTILALTYHGAMGDWRDSLTVWLTYLSHWPADFITGQKPTWPGGPTIGLNLYMVPGIDPVIEIALIAVCWAAYRRSLPQETRSRAIGWLIPAGLIAMHLAFVIVSTPALRP